MTVASRGTRDFWQLYRDLPVEVRESARKAYRRWQHDAFHPSLHFKKLRNKNWSVRISLNYRAIGKFTDKPERGWREAKNACRPVRVGISFHGQW